MKNVGVAILLAILFGPLGMLYSTVWGALIMFVVSLTVGIITLGLGFLLTWPVCIIWAGIAASSYNDNFMRQMQDNRHQVVRAFQNEIQQLKKEIIPQPGENNKKMHNNIIYAKPENTNLTISNLSIGEIIVDKTCKWNNKSFRGNKTVSQSSSFFYWKIAGKNHYKVKDNVPHITIISLNPIGKNCFDNSTNRNSINGSNNWNDSGKNNATEGLRTFLHEIFLNGFSEEFKNVILETNLPNKTFDDDYYETNDLVFIPSTTELGLNETEYSILEIGTKLELFNDSNASDLFNSDSLIWTRSPVRNEPNTLCCSSSGVIVKCDAFYKMVNVYPVINIKSDISINAYKNEKGEFEIAWE